MSRAEGIEDMRFVMAQFWAKKPVEHTLFKQLEKVEKDVKSHEGKGSIAAWKRRRGHVVHDEKGIHIKVG